MNIVLMDLAILEVPKSKSFTIFSLCVFAFEKSPEFAGIILRENDFQVKPAFRDKISPVLDLDITADELISALLNLASSENVSILDSCGVGHLGSHLLVAAIEPIAVFNVSNDDPHQTLSFLDKQLSGKSAAIFTISYDFGLKLLGLAPANKPFESPLEPDISLALYDALIIHDYDTGKTRLTGNADKLYAFSTKIDKNISEFKFEISDDPPVVTSNFTKDEYLAGIEAIKEQIRNGNTYQTNLTQKLTAILPSELTPQTIFARLRRDHPAPFSAFIQRPDSTVISASPERFFQIEAASITTSPIKGTRRRGNTKSEDDALRRELLASPKDRAENTMIVDLLRNDLGRVCEYGSVRVEKLCDLEQHPTLFHLVSTVTGDLRPNTAFSEILKAIFPCGSITGAPKISTMRIIEELEPASRGLSMGAIGYYIPEVHRAKSLDVGLWPVNPTFVLSVAIRTMVIRENTATFNVGGGIVIDSDPESEYQETLTKAKALLDAIGADCSEFQLDS